MKNSDGWFIGDTVEVTVRGFVDGWNKDGAIIALHHSHNADGPIIAQFDTLTRVPDFED